MAPPTIVGRVYPFTHKGHGFLSYLGGGVVCFVWNGLKLPRYEKPVIRRVPKSSPCSNHRAHGEESLCRGPNTEHTVKIKLTAKAGFVVCSNLSTRRKQASPCALTLAHGETISLPCAKDRHTAKIAPRGPTFTAGQRRHILPCASVRHTANRPFCRVPHGGTRQT